jgi:hypothetical protein
VPGLARAPASRPAALVVCVAVHVLASPPQLLNLFSADSRSQLAKGRAVTQLLSEPGIDIGLAAAVRSNISTDAFLARFRDVERMLEGKFTAVSGRFSRPPRREDFSTLTLSEEDLDDLRDCRPGRCGLKLSASEISRIRAAIAPAGRRWKEAALDAFKGVLADRAGAFLARGLAGLVVYEDGDDVVLPDPVTRHHLDAMERRGIARPHVLSFLRTYPAEASGAESFLFWSKDTLADTKPVISITHAAIVRPGDDSPPVAVMTQVYASHYFNASVSVTTLVPAGDTRSDLVYVRLSSVDVFDGAFGGLIRRMVNRRVKSEGPKAIDALRRKLEAPMD